MRLNFTTATIAAMLALGCVDRPALTLGLVRESHQLRIVNDTDQTLTKCVFLIHGWEGTIARVPAHGQVTITRPPFGPQSDLVQMHCEDPHRQWIAVHLEPTP